MNPKKKNSIAKAIRLIGTIIFIVIVNHVYAQDTLVYYLNAKDFQLNLRLFVSQKKYELNYSHNRIDSGWNRWESGQFKVRGERIILKTDLITDETNLQKMKLKSIDCNREKKNVFKTVNFESCLEIVRVKNKEFDRRILSEK